MNLNSQMKGSILLVALASILTWVNQSSAEEKEQKEVDRCPPVAQQAVASAAAIGDLMSKLKAAATPTHPFSPYPNS